MAQKLESISEVTPVHPRPRFTPLLVAKERAATAFQEPPKEQCLRNSLYFPFV